MVLSMDSKELELSILSKIDKDDFFSNSREDDSICSIVSLLDIVSEVKGVVDEFIDLM